MIEPPRISYRMREYRRTCGFFLRPPFMTRVLLKGCAPASVADRAEWIIWNLFGDDPYRPADSALLACLRADGYRISDAMFGRAVEALRSAGIIVGDQLHPDLLRGWEREWRRCKREGLHYERAPAPEGGEA